MYVINGAKKPRTPKIPVGKYDCEAKDVYFDPDYIEGEVFKVDYKLTNGNGETFEYTESFYIVGTNDRTDQFFEYLEDNGIQEREDGLPDLVGFHEEVDLRKKVGYSKPVIAKRAPL